MSEEIPKDNNKKTRRKTKKVTISEETLGPFENKNRLLLLRKIKQIIFNDENIINVKRTPIAKHSGKNVWQGYIVCDIKK